MLISPYPTVAQPGGRLPEVHVHRCTCGKPLVPTRLNADDLDLRFLYSAAELKGVLDPNGYRCTDLLECRKMYARDPSGTIRPVTAQIRHDFHPLSPGLWEIAECLSIP